MATYRVVRGHLEEVYVEADSKEEAQAYVENSAVFGVIFDHQIISAELAEERASYDLLRKIGEDWRFVHRGFSMAVLIDHWETMTPEQRGPYEYAIALTDGTPMVFMRPGGLNGATDTE